MMPLGCTAPLPAFPAPGASEVLGLKIEGRMPLDREVNDGKQGSLKFFFLI